MNDETVVICPVTIGTTNDPHDAEPIKMHIPMGDGQSVTLNMTERQAALVIMQLQASVKRIRTRETK